LLTLFDTDGDGILSGDEVEEAPARLWELDRDLNAELSSDELGLVLASRWQERRRAVRGHLPVEPTQPEAELPVLPDTPRDDRSRFQAYPLRSADPARALAILQQVFRGKTEVRMTVDERTGSLLVLAPSSAHALIRNTLADLLQEDRAGLPGFGPAVEGEEGMPELALPAVPRVVPLFNTRARDILRAVKQLYRDRITEPRRDPRFPREESIAGEPVVPAGKMVIGEGEDPDTIVISADDELFFEVLDLIERLDGTQEPPLEEMPVPPGS
jgi:hypothetical protein